MVSEKDLQQDIDGMLNGSAQERLRRTERTGTIFPQAQQETRDLSTLQRTSIQLDRSMQHSDARLFLPIDAQGQQLIAESSVPVSQIQGLFALLVELHKLFSARRQAATQQPFQVYWEVDTDLIAFNAHGNLWYNAAKDSAFHDTAARSRFWYLVICHELAHNFIHGHDSDFSQQMSEIVLTYSQGFMGWKSMPSNSAAFN